MPLAHHSTGFTGVTPNPNDPTIKAILSRVQVIGGIPFLQIGEVPGWGPVLVPLAALVRPREPVQLELDFTVGMEL